jgi:hypothetical protein
VNGAALTIDRFGNANSAYNFDGVNDFIDAGDFYNFGNSNFTVSCWFKLVPTSANASLVSKREVNMQGNWWVQEVNGFQIDESAQSSILTLTHPTPLNKQLWTNYIIIREGNILSFYVNGVLSDQETLSTAYNMNNNANLLFGTTFLEGSYVGLLKGKLDDISIYSRAIDSEEISSLYTTTTSTVATPPCPTLATNLQTGLVGYWPFCGNANDESGNGNNGTVNGATLATDRFGNSNSAYSFDGVNDFIQTNNISFANGGDFTICIWVNLAEAYASGFPQHFILANNVGSGGAYLNTDTNLSQFGCNDLNTNISLNNWHHFVAIKSGTNYNLYIDDLFVGVNSNCNTNFINGFPIYFGNSSVNTEFTHGKLDDISIYNRALTPAEITQLFTDQTSLVDVPCTPFLGEDQTICAGTSVTLNATSAPSSVAACQTLPTNLQTGLVGYWPFCGNANDASGNGNNGTVNGATLTTDRFGNANNAYAFDGVNDYVDLGNLNYISTGVSGEYTVSLWVNPASLGDYPADNLGSLLFGDEIYQNNGVVLSLHNSFGFNVYTVGSNNISICNCVPNLNEWINYTVTQNSNGISLYINGAYDMLLSNSINSETTTPTRIGYFYQLQTRAFHGVIDDVTVHNRALTASEIQQLYTLGQSTYLWSTGATTATINVTPTSTTTYTCTVTDANGNVCTDSVTVFVPQIEATDLTICAGETTTLSVSGINSTATPSACPTLPSNLQTGLVGYWPFCGNANDASGNGNNGTVNGATLTTDRFGNANNAYSFDGNDVINYPRTTLSSFSVSAWINPATADCYIPLVDAYPNSWEILADCNSGQLTFIVFYPTNNTTYYSTNIPLNPNNWYHIGAIYDAPNIKIYVNGLLVLNQNTIPIPNVSGLMNFGASISGSAQYLNGKLDDIAIYNRALTASEIQQLFTLGQTTYLWSNGATTPTINVSPTANTTYTCTVTTNGVSCTDTITVVVGNPVASITPNGIVEICQGQSIALTGNGGVSYLWSTGAPTQSITVNTEAVYTVTVTDANGCTDTESQLVKVNFLPNIGVGNAAICPGQSATLTASGGVSYVWSPAIGLSATTGTTVTASPSTSTVYTVTGTGANGCTNTATAAVTVNTLPTATITSATATTFCQGGGVVLNANTGAGLSYQWFNNGTAISGSTSSTYTANESGSYTVVVTNTTTCSSTSNSIDVATVPNLDYFADADADGFGDAATLVSTCVQPQGYVTDNTDCDDSGANINTAATEVCNQADDDCDGLTDDGLVFETYYADNDGDTFGDANNSIDECSQPSGYVTNNTDCNDNNSNQNAASAEICNGEDDDCDGTIDNGLVFLDYYADLDSDGFGAGAATNSCVDLGASYVTNNTDCDDTNANTYLGATEICNTLDDNCDGQADEGLLSVYFIDSDGDIFGNPSVSILACTQPVGYTTDDTDCNDSDASINPGAEDIPANNIDENCDGQIDNGIFELQASINFYPNPTRSELNIQITNALVGNDMYIFDSFGKLVYKQQLISTQTKLSVSEYADGNYIFRIGELVKRFAVEK